MNEYIHEPKRMIDDANVETCAPHEAEFWGVYVLDQDGLPHHLFDAYDEESAIAAIRLLAPQIRDSATTRRNSLRKVCATCGSEDVKLDAWAAWDECQQEWVLDNVFEHVYCISCEAMTSIKEVSS